METLSDRMRLMPLKEGEALDLVLNLAAWLSDPARAGRREAFASFGPENILLDGEGKPSLRLREDASDSRDSREWDDPRVSRGMLPDRPEHDFFRLGMLCLYLLTGKSPLSWTEDGVFSIFPSEGSLIPLGQSVSDPAMKKAMEALLNADGARRKEGLASLEEYALRRFPGKARIAYRAGGRQVGEKEIDFRWPDRVRFTLPAGEVEGGWIAPAVDLAYHPGLRQYTLEVAPKPRGEIWLCANLSSPLQLDRVFRLDEEKKNRIFRLSGVADRKYRLIAAKAVPGQPPALLAQMDFQIPYSRIANRSANLILVYDPAGRTVSLSVTDEGQTRWIIRGQIFRLPEGL